MLVILDNDIAHVAGPSRGTITAVSTVAFTTIDTKHSCRVLLHANIGRLIIALGAGKEIGSISCSNAVAFVDSRCFTSAHIDSFNGFAFSAIVACQRVSASFFVSVGSIIQDITGFFDKLASEASKSSWTTATLANVIGITFTVVDAVVCAFQSHSFQWLGTELGSFKLTHFPRPSSSFRNGCATIAVLGFSGSSIFRKEERSNTSTTVMTDKVVSASLVAIRLILNDRILGHVFKFA
mmetsp:Transcript_31581/g.76264  ORF Transcript_31581/g.76264 Transcript_31581/m.76264 type:complete len:238 (+) Transcript_31581:2154-2867(+)